ncbi:MULTISPECIES: tRNA pseudouridine(55) synthase TruB [unclassified Gilliamella]|uniref:tRNA pseudouridine(55) synthase TruB n=1 Tax=unclassified Gilliamella TaxID=2685620 RepID=UPI002269D6BD|nr:MULTISPECIES: tRNA pseudouridine(55) synthase TruB [unclassified Gilliamella]MCX8583642.1 tRNA pseudouridine(55) synthase TruB [Gilliamella sp. B3372]MCX8594774.1 tRNA pseudouridine(55) synthase TruB [Gilliamella sp. B3367]MCX8597151.1 tRNA pseudouridine(55) synthase TruB [Gilliamella sp. B3493]MCX8598785.1 tRNA pseudouridine(55) synthase TruB [Gilliamella sp. B3486]MCX8675506.1 tRNA pseudouridine(55) synthase TruB [Gilliamella sp. B3023]
MMNIKKTRRDVHGVLLLDKPQGMTSNDALQKVKRLFNAKKAGHTGALDPLATGMLPICFGEATKFSQYLLDSDKRYRVIAKLGERTDTSDADGQIISTRSVNITQSQIEEALTHFRGDILQVPTMFSALKYQGKPLYEYARQGIVIEREARPITIYENQFIQYDSTKHELTLEIHCSKGTYIRTIIDDLGELLGCGAHVIYLRRLQVSNYPIDNMITLDELQNEPMLMPVDSPLQDRPKVVLSESQGKDILLGRTVIVENSVSVETLVRIYQGQQFIGAGTQILNKLSPKRLISTS